MSDMCGKCPACLYYAKKEKDMENKPELEVPLEEQFRYHPPTTVERKAKHEAINAAALECAKVLCTCVRSAKNQQKMIDAIQNARMLANQYVTFEEIKNEL